MASVALLKTFISCRASVCVIRFFLSYSQLPLFQSGHYAALINRLHKRASCYPEFGDGMLEGVWKLRREDALGPCAETVTGAGPKTFALYGLANFMFECAEGAQERWREGCGR